MWGTDLWDQYDGVCSHLDSRLDQVKKITNFVKDRIKIEQDYANQLKKLNKSYAKMKTDETKFPSTECFAKIVTHADELASYHEAFSNKLQAEVYDALKKLLTDQGKEKKVAMSDASKLQNSFNAALSSNDKVKKKYESAQQDADKAYMAYQKADADMTLSRAAVEKIRKTSDLKQSEAEDVKAVFQTSIEDTNKTQSDHYNTKMPVVFKHLQQIDETRTTEVTKHFVTYINLESEILPQWTESERKCKTQFESVRPEADSKQLVGDLCSGNPIPGDMFMDDLIMGSNGGDKRSKKGSHGGAHGPPPSVTSSISVDLFDNLPPNKRKKKLSVRLTDLKSSSKKEEAELRALEKMTSVYSANPSLGDPSVTQQKIAPLVTKCEAINEEAYKIECALAALENRDPPPTPSPVASAPSTLDGGESPSKPSELGEDKVKKSSSMTWSDDFQESPNHCTVLYDFVASTDGELSVKYGETLELLQDDGSGWISVKRGPDQGYIPLSYVQMQ